MLKVMYGCKQKGVNPAAGSPTATLLRLRSSYQAVFRHGPTNTVIVLSLQISKGLRQQCTSIPKASNPLDSRSVTGGEYKAQVQIHRGVLIHDY